MALNISLNQKQTTSLSMTPQLQQAIKLLQYSSQELNEFVENELNNNPLLERVEQENTQESPPSIDDYDAPLPTSDDPQIMDSAQYLKEQPGSALESSALDGDFSNDYDGDIAGAGVMDTHLSSNASINDQEPVYSDAGSYSSKGQDGGSFNNKDNDMLADITRPPSLREHLQDQLRLDVQDFNQQAIGNFLIDYVKPSGLLGLSTSEAARLLGIGEDKILPVLAKCQQFDPAGIMARDYPECFKLQFMDKGQLTPAIEIMLDNLNLVAAREWKKLLKACKVGRDELLDMVTKLKQLNPKPGSLFDQEHNLAITPDVLIAMDSKNRFVIELNPETVPKLIVNEGLYRRVVEVDKDPTAKEYIRNHRHNASWLVSSLRQRATTILKVSEEIVRQQSGFFHHGVSYLRPMVLKEVASAIDLHESTISRVTANKFLACNRGVFELKYFFTPPIQGNDGDQHSAEAVRHRLKTLIDAEDTEKILSDDQLEIMLNEEGMNIRRRTIAKYRDAMNIPSSIQRRRQKSQSKL